MANDGRRWLAWHHPRIWWMGRSHPVRQVLYGAILMAVIIVVLLLLASLTSNY